MEELNDNNISLREYVKERVDSILEEISTLRKDFSLDVEVARQSAKEALATANYAAEKALNAIDKRLEGVNEIRTQMLDQQRTFIPRNEVNLIFDTLCKRIDKIEITITEAIGSKKGMGEGIGYVIGIIGIVAAVISFFGR